ncbi:hypothetical protein SAY86_007634 [Trapa natans]|uniref:Uncharacterized protein n=1 Tax=Trapa natans TaxID=22666 RepID=A0AAN7R0I2_TRANT|nr:hypothetical protein SAY86_007634 [Trapa natans]
MDTLSDVPSLSGCARHPTLRHLPGVCPSCLRERLQRLIESQEAMAGAHLSQRLCLKSPSCSSSCLEYGSFRGSNRRDGSAAAAENRLLLLAARVRGSLRKSHSVAAAGAGTRRSNEHEKLKRGFWWKLIRFRWNHHNDHHQSVGSLGHAFMC